MKIDELFETTSAGSIASVSSPIGGIQRRATTPSLFGYVAEPNEKKKKKKKKKTTESLDTVETPTAKDIAAMHGIENVDRILREIIIGTRHELEHTTNRTDAREIAMDHLKENPYYYSELDKAGL